MHIDDKKLEKFGQENMLWNSLLLGGVSLKGDAWRDPDSDDHYYFYTTHPMVLTGQLDMNALSGVIMFEGFEYPGGMKMPGVQPEKILEYVKVEEHREDGWFYLSVTEQP
jgi:hypothetical protein